MPREFKKVLCGTDFSQHSYDALAWALRFAKLADGTLIVAHFVHVPSGDVYSDEAWPRTFEQARVRARSLAPLLNAALAAPLAQRDYAAVRQIMRDSRTEDALNYLILLDENNRVVAAAGWDAGKPLPPLEDIESRAGDSAAVESAGY